MFARARLVGPVTLATLLAACGADSNDAPLEVSVAGGGSAGATGVAGASGSAVAGAAGSTSAGSGGSTSAGAAGSTSAGSGGSTSAGSGGSTTAGAGGSTTAGAGGSTTAGTGGSAAAGKGGSTAGGAAGSTAAGAGGASGGAAGASTGGSAGTSGAAGGTGATVSTLTTLAGSSACYKYQWKDRGQAPKGYIKGVALVFARAVCEPMRSDVPVVSQANTGDDVKDAISWFNSNFAAVSMSNDVAGVDTLRHAYTLLIGLGMRESSGEHCVGRDTSASNTTADSAEAGAWQTSWDSHYASAELPKLFEKYKADGSGCLLSTFAEGVSCSAADWQNWGSGDGFDFQKLEKECPAFAAEYAAVMLRVAGGSKGHYGPLRTKAAEIRPECDDLLKQVQTIVEANPSLCASL